MKCILASGYLDETVERRIVNDFKAGTMRKPYNVADAAELIQKMLSREKIDELESFVLS